MKNVKGIFTIIQVWYLLSCQTSLAQFNLIPSNTSITLNYLSILNNNIFIAGIDGYKVKSNNECKTLHQLPITAIGTLQTVYRLDTNTIFKSLSGNTQWSLNKSIDGGQTWQWRYSVFGNCDNLTFIDTSVGFSSYFMSSFITTNGGYNWSAINLNPTGLSVTTIKTFSTNFVSLCGVISGTNVCFLSTNKGSSWNFTKISSVGNILSINYLEDFLFFNSDTLVAIGQNHQFYYSNNNGQSWTSASVPLYKSYGVCFKNRNEAYVVGHDSLGIGAIAKTTDFGNTWHTLKTGIKSNLLKMGIVNDSIAILIGTNGTIIRWNYRSSFITSSNDEELNNNREIHVFPNPAREHLNIQLKKIKKQSALKIEIVNILGMRCNTTYLSESDKCIIDVSHLPNGIYFLQVWEKDQLISTKKFVKE